MSIPSIKGGVTFHQDNQPNLKGTLRSINYLLKNNTIL